MARFGRHLPLLLTLTLLSPGLLASSCSSPEPRPEPAPLTHSGRVRPAPIKALPVQAEAQGATTEQPQGPPGLQPIEHPEALSAAFEKLKAVETGAPGAKVRFVHYGDSHIASDQWTGVVRRRLQDRFGDGGHGFILPGKPWRTYYHMDVDHGVGRSQDWDTQRVRVRDTGTDGMLGLGGVSVAAARRGASVWLSTEGDGPVGQAVGSFEVFFLQQPRGGKADLLLDGRPAGILDTRGRALAPGYHRVEAPDGPHRFELRVRGGGEVRLFGVAMERPGAGVVYDSVGINGARHHMPMFWNAPLWQAHLGHRPADVLVTTYGSNELGDRLDVEEYRRQVAHVIRLYRAAVPDGACLIVGPPDQALVFDGRDAHAEVLAQARARAAMDPSDPDIWDTPQKLLDIIDALRQTATQEGCAFWDTYKAVGEAGTIDTWARTSPRLAHKDRVHMTAEGYAIIADKMADALLWAYEHHQPGAAPKAPAPAPQDPAIIPPPPRAEPDDGPQTPAARTPKAASDDAKNP